ncbi:MAG TPA: TonB-dependent receptor, partial [Longimicrobiaceae bacterium]|nr:TonB-dependent receptor [Longimicrobiaceae bacterium]
AAGPAAARAQFPGELEGRVPDAATGAPVAAATVELPRAGRSAATDGAGAFRLRGLEPGEYRVSVRRTGYAPRETVVTVRNGRTERIAVALHPLPVALAAVRATAAPEAAFGSTRLGRAEVEASGARTAGDLVARLPGAVVRSTGPTGEQTVSLRGGAPDAVLVLVDGVAVNDPVTGVADLSTVPAHAVESVTVLPGAQAARYGPRAETGVVVIETRAPDVRRAASLSAGTLEEAAGAGEWGGAAGALLWSVGGQARHLGGAFDYERDPNDPRTVRRANADLDEGSVFAAARAGLAGGELRMRGGWEAVDRGIPGLGYAPSPEARQELARWRGAAAWRRASARGSASASLAGALQRARFRDPAPPFGLPYDDVTRVGTLQLRTEAVRLGEVGLLRGVGTGVEGTLQRVDAGSLAESAPRTRTDLGAFAHASAGAERGGVEVVLTAQARLDRDGLAGEWHATRALALGAAWAGARLQLANRSAYSPPTLGDQFFREGVAVAPNPDLRPERVPNEWELSASLSRALGGAELSAGGAAYTADVRGMIVWMPDFRFVWSPRNTDVRRRGVDGWAELALPARRLRLAGAWSLARVTYDRPGEADTVQVVYRPRHSGWVRGEWTPGPWRLELSGAYTGSRNPTPTSATALPGFWSLALAAARDWRLGRWTLTTAVDVDRLLDEKESLIFGYPEPGRRVRLDLRVRRADARN